jgi:type IV secretory pathway VirB10-like protein
MFTPDLSVLNIGLMAVIAIILAFYAIFLVKLKPTKEHEPTSNRDFEKGEETVMKPKRPMKQTMPAKTINEEPASTHENEKIPEEDVEGIQTRTHIEERARALTQEIRKRKKDIEAKKSFFLFGKKNFEGCTHKFGYLKSLPKNTPLPDECFGCPQILECLMRSKKK